MNICAIICEYNPFHSGHAYHLQQARELSNADILICLMSGDFVQRAEPAVISKYLRAKAALKNGADIVLELPTVFATSNGQKFAEGAVKILKNLNVTHLAFGCENNDLNLLKKIAEIQVLECDYFKTQLKALLDAGYAYASAYSLATQKTLNLQDNNSSMCDIVLQMPNNLLAIEYLKATYRLKCDIEPLIILRKGNGFNSTDSQGEYISATAARELLKENKASDLKNYLPNNIFNEFIEEYNDYYPSTSIFNVLALNALRNNCPADLFDDSEGIINKLIENSLKYCNLETVLNQTKSKRYTFARLKRLTLQALLGITKNLFKTIDIYNQDTIIKSRLLGLRANVKPMLKYFSDNIIIQNHQLENNNFCQQSILDIDKKASNIYSLVTRKNGYQYYENKIIIV